MTRYFMRDTPLCQMEQQMMTPPYFKPRGHGRYYPGFQYSRDDMECPYCMNFRRNHPCPLEQCVCLDERIVAGAIDLNEFVRDCFFPEAGAQLQARLERSFNGCSIEFFLSDSHRERWQHWRERCFRMPNSINDLNDMIRVAEQVSDYILIPNVNSDVTLGRYVAVAGQIQGDPRFPEAAWPYLDFAKIGAEYYAEHGGAYTYAGYVLRKQDDELVREKKSKIQLDLSSSQAQVSVCLPATKEELERVKRTLGIDCFAEAAVTKVLFSVPYMDEHIPTTGVCVEDANELAWAIEGMQCEDGELLKYLSVLSVEQPGTMQEALRCAMNLDDYERIPEDTYEYGQAVLRRIGADDELIDTIDGYMDFEKLGEDTMAEEGVRRTEFGLIRRCSSPFAEETQAMEMGDLS